MKRKPILKPQFQGCGNCGRIAEIVLENEDRIWNYNFMCLTLNGKEIKISDSLTVATFLFLFHL